MGKRLGEEMQQAAAMLVFEVSVVWRRIPFALLVEVRRG